MGDKFYAVAHGRTPGVYDNWNEAQKQIKDFPQAVYKKFATKEEAEEFFKVRQPERVSLDVDETAKKFYAVARGKVIGIFTDFEEVKKHIADYPQPVYKKFEDLAEAKAYFKKYTTGDDNTEGAKSEEGGEAGSADKEKEKEKPHSEEDGKDKSHEEDESKRRAKLQEKVYYAVARGHKPGVYETWAECQEQTKDFKGAKFKKFTNEEDAKMFAEGKTLKQIEERKRPHDKDEEEEEVEQKKPAKEKEKA